MSYTTKRSNKSRRQTGFGSKTSLGRLISSTFEKHSKFVFFGSRLNDEMCKEFLRLCLKYTETPGNDNKLIEYGVRALNRVSKIMLVVGQHYDEGATHPGTNLARLLFAIQEVCRFKHQLDYCLEVIAGKDPQPIESNWFSVQMLNVARDSKEPTLILLACIGVGIESVYAERCIMDIWTDATFTTSKEMCINLLNTVRMVLSTRCDIFSVFVDALLGCVDYEDLETPVFDVVDPVEPKIQEVVVRKRGRPRGTPQVSKSGKPLGRPPVRVPKSDKPVGRPRGSTKERIVKKPKCICDCSDDDEPRPKKVKLGQTVNFLVATDDGGYRVVIGTVVENMVQESTTNQFVQMVDELGWDDSCDEKTEPEVAASECTTIETNENPEANGDNDQLLEIVLQLEEMETQFHLQQFEATLDRVRKEFESDSTRGLDDLDLLCFEGLDNAEMQSFEESRLQGLDSVESQGFEEPCLQGLDNAEMQGLDRIESQGLKESNLQNSEETNLENLVGDSLANISESELLQLDAQLKVLLEEAENLNPSMDTYNPSMSTFSSTEPQDDAEWLKQLGLLQDTTVSKLDKLPTLFDGEPLELYMEGVNWDTYL